MCGVVVCVWVDAVVCSVVVCVLCAVCCVCDWARLNGLAVWARIYLVAGG